jgi:hypothetical protein
MSGGMAMFRFQLRTAVREARRGSVTRRPPRTPARPRRRTVVRLWLPLTPLWILLAPFALLLAPLLALARDTRDLPPYRAAFAVGRALLAMSGTVVDLDSRHALVRIRIL